MTGDETRGSMALSEKLTCSIIDKLIASLPSLSSHHSRNSEVYALLSLVARKEIEGLFCAGQSKAVVFGPFGDLVFPYHRMGAIDSLNLFDLDELILFSFYWRNRYKYRRVLDVGANIGLHSIVLSKCGFSVRAYEPDEGHFEVLRRNLSMNDCPNVEPVRAAVSSKAGDMQFVRVLGNTTSSHLLGSKSNPYGELVTYPVKVDAIRPLIAWADLVKLDAEGHEKEIILATNHEDWLDTDAVVEIENRANGASIINHLSGLGVQLYSQKTNWSRVNCLEDMPESYREGSVFVTCKDEMPWRDTGANTSDLDGGANLP